MQVTAKRKSPAMLANKNMTNIYIDESGYTGFDLLNISQPLQGASSLRIDEKSAKILVDEYFPKRRGLELKHQKLSKRKTNWRSLLEVQRIILQDHMGFTYICNKKYLLTLMFLDTCVEPFFHDKGIDFYEGGQNYSLASLIYYTAPTFWGKDNYATILYLFQRAVRTKLGLNIQTLIEKAISLQNRELSEYLFPLAIEHPDCIREIKSPEINTDAAFIVLLSLISHIEKYVKCKYTIVHDTSKNLANYDKLIKIFIGIDDNVSFRQTAETQLKFPLKLSAVRQEDSKSNYGIQLADLLVGGMVENGLSLMGLIEKNDYNQSVIGLYGKTNFLSMLPSLDFIGDKRFRRRTEASKTIDFIENKLR